MPGNVAPPPRRNLSSPRLIYLDNSIIVKINGKLPLTSPCAKLSRKKRKQDIQEFCKGNVTNYSSIKLSASENSSPYSKNECTLFNNKYYA